MGTRARINVMEDGETLVSIYRQYDGYPSGLGQELANFIKGKKMVNGYSGKDAHEFNGMGCLAAQLIAHLKHGVGNVYIRNVGPGSQGEEYIYTLSAAKNGQIIMRVVEGGMTAFGLPGDDEADMKTVYYGRAKDFDAKQLEEQEA